MAAPGFYQTILCPFCGWVATGGRMCQGCREGQARLGIRLQPLPAHRLKRVCRGCGKPYWNQGWHLENECTA